MTTATASPFSYALDPSGSELRRALLIVERPRMRLLRREAVVLAGAISVLCGSLTATLLG